MRTLNQSWLLSAAVFVVAAFPCQTRAERYDYPKQKPLAFANKLDANPTPSSAASFNCGHASSAVEQRICSDLSLARADGELDFSYRLLLHWSGSSKRPEIRDQQKIWLRRRDACGDAECLGSAYDGRSSELREQVRAAEVNRTRHVARPGACEVTRIEAIAGRLWDVEGQKPNGMSFVYANGVTQISYDRDSKALRSRLGDLVRVCLVSIPRHCPPGDDRGRVYSSYNLRTQIRWSLPDAEHGCGGA